MRILIVEDDDRVAEALEAFLSRSGFAIIRASDGARALNALAPEIDVVLLDLGLPDMDGIDVCRGIRAQSAVPVIIATARSDVNERIRGLRAGADDFVVKPYDVRELIARIEAVTRRFQQADTLSPLPGDRPQIESDGVRIDLVARRVIVDRMPVDLTRKEFDIVAVLARYPGVPVPRERIIREVWNTDWQSFARSLEVHVASIRRKIGRPALIETVRGVGYRLEA